MFNVVCSKPVAVLAGVLAILLWAHDTIAGSCCQEVTTETSCSGCIQILTSPDRYINVGSNSITECVSSDQSSGCSQIERECVSLMNGNLYTSGCSQVVGTISISLSVPQCSAISYPCHVGS